MSNADEDNEEEKEEEEEDEAFEPEEELSAKDERAVEDEDWGDLGDFDAAGRLAELDGLAQEAAAAAAAAPAAESDDEERDDEEGEEGEDEDGETKTAAAKRRQATNLMQVLMVISNPQMQAAMRACSALLEPLRTCQVQLQSKKVLDPDLIAAFENAYANLESYVKDENSYLQAMRSAREPITLAATIAEPEELKLTINFEESEDGSITATGIKDITRPIIPVKYDEQEANVAWREVVELTRLPVQRAVKQYMKWLPDEFRVAKRRSFAGLMVDVKLVPMAELLKQKNALPRRMRAKGAAAGSGAGAGAGAGVVDELAHRDGRARRRNDHVAVHAAH